MTYPLADFSLTHMVSLGAALRSAASSATSMEEAAQGVVRELQTRLVDAEGTNACALVRLFTTLNFAELDESLQGFGRGLMSDHDLREDTKSLTLLATAGDEPAWCCRKNSVGHQTIPLPSPQVVDQIPMIAQLIAQLGLEVSMVTHPDPDLILELDQKQYNVFHVPQAAGSPFIPHQAGFVDRYGIESVLGFGGVFPTGGMFVVLMFSKTPISVSVANLFRPMALNVKLALLPFVFGPHLMEQNQ